MGKKKEVRVNKNLKFRLAIRDELGTIYGGKSAMIDAPTVIEACMVYFGQWGEFPTEVEWLPEGAEGIEERQYTALNQLRNEANQAKAIAESLRNRQEGYVTQVKALEAKVKRTEEREKGWKESYRMVAHYLEKIVVNAQAVLNKLAEGDALETTQEMVQADKVAYTFFGTLDKVVAAAEVDQMRGRRPALEELHVDPDEDRWDNDDYNTTYNEI